MLVTWSNLALFELVVGNHPVILLSEFNGRFWLSNWKHLAWLVAATTIERRQREAQTRDLRCDELTWNTLVSHLNWLETWKHPSHDVIDDGLGLLTSAAPDSDLVLPTASQATVETNAGCGSLSNHAGMTADGDWVNGANDG